MQIKPIFEYATGDFETETGVLICVSNRKHGSVDLCFGASAGTNSNIPFARIKLHSMDRAIAADSVFEDARKLGEEIARRWNNSQEKQ